jgi:hypothetical protein
MKTFPPSLAGALLLLLGAAPQAQASQLVPQNLRHMIEKSDLIVTGEVRQVRDGIANGLPYTEVTLKVKGSLKHELKPDSDYSFRQYGLLKARKMPNGSFMLPAKIEGMPSWTVGERVTAFMNKPAARSGLVTPVGLAQGKLTASGSRLANGFNNQGLFKDVKVEAGRLNADETAMLAKPNGAVEHGVLLQLVKRAVKEQWIEKGVMR